MSLRLSRYSNDVDFLQRQFTLRSANRLCVIGIHFLADQPLLNA